MSVAGFLPGLGRGGMIHSLDVMETFGVSGSGETMALIDMVLESRDGETGDFGLAAAGRKDTFAGGSAMGASRCLAGALEALADKISARAGEALLLVALGLGVGLLLLLPMLLACRAPTFTDDIGAAEDYDALLGYRFTSGSSKF